MIRRFASHQGVDDPMMVVIWDTDTGVIEWELNPDDTPWHEGANFLLRYYYELPPRDERLTVPRGL